MPGVTKWFPFPWISNFGYFSVLSKYAPKIILLFSKRFKFFFFLFSWMRYCMNKTDSFLFSNKAFYWAACYNFPTWVNFSPSKTGSLLVYEYSLEVCYSKVLDTSLLLFYMYFQQQWFHCRGHNFLVTGYQTWNISVTWGLSHMQELLGHLHYHSTKQINFNFLQLFR